MKRFLKKILPIKFLKATFLVYNTIKIHTIDRILYKKYTESDEEIVKSERMNPFLQMNIGVDKFSTTIQEGFQRWLDPQWSQDEYIVCIKKQVLIDPITGWGIVNRRLIYPSLGFASAPHVHKPGVWRILRKKEYRKFDCILSLRDTGEENYFHFFNDVLPKIWLLKDAKLLSQSLTVVVSEQLWRKEYFQYFLQHPDLKKLNWHVQKDDWVVAEQVIFCKPFTHTKKFWDNIVAFSSRHQSKSNDLKIFITRTRNSLRFVENHEQLSELLTENNFQIVDAGTMTFENQIHLFSSARVLMGIHGAGLSNMIFRGDKKLTVVEIFPPGPYLPFHYIMLANLYGYNYQPLVGLPGLEKNSGGFRIDLIALERELKEFV